MFRAFAKEFLQYAKTHTKPGRRILRHDVVLFREVDMFTDKFHRNWEGPFAFTRESVAIHAPRRSGVYQLFYQGHVSYIGIATESIHSRLEKHVTGEGNWAAARRTAHADYQFVYFLCDGVTAKQIESHVITTEKPPFNVKPEYKHFIGNITVH